MKIKLLLFFCFSIALLTQGKPSEKLSKVDSLHENSSELHALAGGQVDKKLEDKGMMGIFNQNGQKTFFYNFALTTHQNAFDPTNAMKFSLEHQNPLTTGWIEGKNENNQISIEERYRKNKIVNTTRNWY